MYLFKLKQVIKVNMSREYIAILLRDERLLTKFAWLQNETKLGVIFLVYIENKMNIFKTGMDEQILTRL